MESIRKVTQLNIWALVLIYIVNYVVSRPVIDSTLRPLHCEDILDPVSKEQCFNSSGTPFNSPSQHRSPEPSNVGLSRVPRTAIRRRTCLQGLSPDAATQSKKSTTPWKYVRKCGKDWVFPKCLHQAVCLCNGCINPASEIPGEEYPLTHAVSAPVIAKVEVLVNASTHHRRLTSLTDRQPYQIRIVKLHVGCHCVRIGGG